MTGSIRNRGRGTWGLTISLGRDPNGRRIRRYFTFKGTKRDAERELRRLLAEFEVAPMPVAERISLRDWFPRWIEEYGTVRRWRQSTIDRYASIAREHLIPQLGDVLVDELSTRRVQRLQMALLREGMDPKGVQLVRTVLSGAINYAIAMGYARYNAVRDVKPPSVPRREVKPPSAETVSAMLKLAEAEEHPLFPAIFVQVCTGVRRGELLALTWDNVDLDKPEISIERSLGRRSTGLVVDPPKTERGRRTIRLPAVAADVLRTHQQRQANHKEQYQEIYKDNNLVFADEFGQFINPMSLTRAVRTLGERVGHPKMRNHDLRHFHISQSLELGVPIAETSARAGHSDPSITWRVYAHLLPGAEPATPGVIDDAMAAFRLDVGSETPEDDGPRDC